jgi:hypothetical protein
MRKIESCQVEPGLSPIEQDVMMINTQGQWYIASKKEE